MLTSCPPESNYFELCTKEDDGMLGFDWTFVVPVLGADGYLYKNIYCALCNSVYDSQPVNITVDCVDNEKQNSLKTTSTRKNKFIAFKKFYSHTSLEVLQPQQCLRIHDSGMK